MPPVNAKHALDLSRKHKDRGHEAYAMRLLGEVAVRREPPESAEAELELTRVPG